MAKLKKRHKHKGFRFSVGEICTQNIGEICTQSNGEICTQNIGEICTQNIGEICTRTIGERNGKANEKSEPEERRRDLP